MKKLCVRSLFLTAVLATSAAYADTPVIVPRESAQQQTAQLNAAVNALIAQLGASPVIRAVPEGAQAIAAVAALLAPVRELERILASAPMTTPQGAPLAPPQVIVQAPPPPVVVEAPPPPPPPPAGPTPISDGDLGRIMGAIRGESFSRQQLGVLEQTVGNHHFLISQVARLLDLFSFGRDKLKALRALAPRILDKQNAFELNRAFTFDSEKNQARRILSE